MVMMWSAPATDSMLATSLAEMGARLCSRDQEMMGHTTVQTTTLFQQHTSQPAWLEEQL